MVNRNEIGALVEISEYKNREYHKGNFVQGIIIHPKHDNTPNYCVRVKITAWKSGYECRKSYEHLNFPSNEVWYLGQKDNIKYSIW